MSDYTYRIHPAINIARVGNSEEYYIAPETMAGLPVEGGGNTVGGLPIKPGTEAETISSSDLRDASGALKRQAARFRVFQYPVLDTDESYPNGGGTEIKIGSAVDGKTVTDIIWTVHLANKKTNWYQMTESPGMEGVEAYDNGNFPPLRNKPEGQPSDPGRLKKLVIDPGPRTIQGANTAAVKFDKGTTASFWKAGTGVQPLTNYPKSFPDDSFKKMSCPAGENIDTLGELQTDSQGRLLVLPAYGRACGWLDAAGNPFPLNDDVNNDGWFDDLADGPVNAVLVFNDGSEAEVVGGAWAVSTDPSYAPQIRNVVSLWDDIYDSWVRKLNLLPDLFAKGDFLASYQASFPDDVYPTFSSSALQRWITNLDQVAMAAHGDVGNITATDKPEDTMLSGLGFIRDPSDPAQSSNDRLMPLSLGDAGKSFLALSLTQYFFLKQWDAGKFSAGPGPKLGPGEFLDKAIHTNCLGGRFSPGIDITFVSREPDFYIQNWQTSDTGPFRIHPKQLNYDAVQSDHPFLTQGYIPRRNDTVGLEPGDVSKFMSLPWHTDYNSCATHRPDPLPPFNNTLYWSWPAQRPVAVYAAKDVQNNQLAPQRFSVRGEGTKTTDPAQVGRYQQRINMLKNWQRIGFVLQGSAIDSGKYDQDYYLEVESQLDDSGNQVEPFPNTVPAGPDS